MKTKEEQLDRLAIFETPTQYLYFSAPGTRTFPCFFLEKEKEHYSFSSEVKASKMPSGSSVRSFNRRVLESKK